MGNIALLFPGQGAQTVGMGRDFCDAFEASREIFDTANRVLDYDLKGLCFEGPQEELNRTAVSQPAMLTMSMAVLRAVETRKPNLAAEAVCTAGLSLGEYTALVAAGALNFEDALRLVDQRGRFMEEACETNPGSMVSILGMDADAVRALCDEVDGVVAANFNSPGQVVISGTPEALKKASALARERGAKRALPLKVQGAFHSPHMAPAQDRLNEALERTEFRAPTRPVIANISAEPVETPEAIRAALRRQLTGSVLWQQSMERMVADGADTFYELGAGNVLAGLLRRVKGAQAVTSINSVGALEQAAG